MKRHLHATLCSSVFAAVFASVFTAPTLAHEAGGEGETDAGSEGYVLKAGNGEELSDGLVAKASPKTGTEGPILVEQTFPRGNATPLHVHDQGGELFYVVSGRGTATLGRRVEAIGPGDVIFVPRGAVHAIGNDEGEAPLVVVFFMDSPELVRQFRAMHERRIANPDTPITAEEMAEIERVFGGARIVERP